MTRLQVAVVQSGSCGPDPAENVDRLIGLFEDAAVPGTDLVVFSELCTTPYFAGTRNPAWYDWAEPVPGPTTARFAEAARRLGSAVIFGMYERTPAGEPYNSAVVIDRHGQLVPGQLPDGGTIPAYRKVAIPSVASGDVNVDEKFYFKPGNGPAVFDVAGTRLGIVICYDRSFPELWQALVHQGAQVIVPVVSSLGWREGLFTQELAIRAFETQCWVVAANRGGKEVHDGVEASFFGLSCVIDPAGTVVDQALPHSQPELLRATLDLEAVTRQRRSFPLARDKRWELYRFLTA